MSTDTELVVFYHCHCVTSFLKDSSPWNYTGYHCLCGHIDGKRTCTKIWLANQKEKENFIRLSEEAINNYNNTGKEYSWGNTLKLTLKPKGMYFATYEIINCEVHDRRFCTAK